MACVTTLALSTRMRVVAAVPACGLLVGSAIGLVVQELPQGLLFVLLFLSLVGASFALLTTRPRIVALAAVAGCACAGALLSADAWRNAWRSSLRVTFESMARDERAAALRAHLFVPEDDRVSVVLVGVLREDAAPTDGGAVSLRVGVLWVGRSVSHARLDPAANPVEGDVLLTAAGTLAVDRMGEWRRGRTIRASAQLRRVSRYLDPGIVDQERAFARRGIALAGSVKSGALIELVERGSVAAETAASLRAFVRRAVAASVGQWSGRAGAIVTAIVIGDRTGLSADIERRLQEAGTYHVIAISGGNIAILAGLALTAFRVAGFLGRGAMVSAIVGLVAYGSLVSGGASVDRATLMAAVYFAGRALDLRGPPLNTLAVVGSLLVASHPLSIADPGFLLTFGASAALLVVASAAPVAGLPPLVRAAALLGVASLAAEVALLPVGAVLFSRITVAGLLLNFVAIPMMALAQVAGMVVVPLFALSTAAAGAVGWVAFLGAEALVRTADLVEVVPITTWRVAAPAPLVVVAYYVGLALWWTLRRRRRLITGSAESTAARVARRSATVLAVGAAVWIAWEPWARMAARGDGRLHVTFIDVGQGDSALVRFPRGATLLVDAGGLAAASSFDIGDRVVGQVLRTAGIHRVDTVVLTHGDGDHIGGAASVLKEFRPWDVWEGTPVPTSALLQRLRASARDRGSRWTRVHVGDEAFFDDVRVVVRHPDLPDWERQDVRNDDSVVMELRWRDVSIVLTGDIGAGVEHELAPIFEAAPLRVVKVPHHGSLTSSSEAFLRALEPRVAVVSVGRANGFGHPAAAVLGRYRSIGAELFRTDRDGAVMIDTDGISLDVHTFSGRSVTIPSTGAPLEGTKDTKSAGSR